jgi:homogentisate 1,2-dioxygenase
MSKLTDFPIDSFFQKRWLYRVRPAVVHQKFKARTSETMLNTSWSGLKPKPDQLRWMPMKIPSESKTFLDGLHTVAGAGEEATKTGLSIHLYVANANMTKTAMYNSDGDYLIVPQLGRLEIQTEFGFLEVFPGEIVVIPRGIYFSIGLPDGPSRGYVLEVYEGHFRLPELGPLGSNGLANSRDFLAPVAAYEDVEEEWTVVNKFMGALFEFKKPHSPFNVVAWQGNYYPYKYDLDKFCTIGSISFDHPDPSIFTVLTCPSAIHGTAVADFVIFPPRWLVQEKTFRPPWFHRNCMSEYMGLIRGVYDAKEVGFVPGGSSLHSIGSAHGPESAVFEKASNAPLAPQKLENTMAFMFESCYMLYVTDFAQKNNIDEDYWKCWQELQHHFDGKVEKEGSK